MHWIRYQITYMHFESFILLRLDKIAFDSLARSERFHVENTHLLLLRALLSIVRDGSEAKCNYVLSRLNVNLIRVTSEDCV